MLLPCALLDALLFRCAPSLLVASLLLGLDPLLLAMLVLPLLLLRVLLLLDVLLLLSMLLLLLLGVLLLLLLLLRMLLLLGMLLLLRMLLLLDMLLLLGMLLLLLWLGVLLLRLLRMLWLPLLWLSMLLLLLTMLLLVPALLRMFFLFSSLLLLRICRSRDSEEQGENGCTCDSNDFHRYYLRCCCLRCLYCKLPVVALTGLPMASPDTRSSTLRFCCRPEALSFEATARVLPKPLADTELAATPCCTR